jgi:hypothetical protein
VRSHLPGSWQPCSECHPRPHLEVFNSLHPLCNLDRRHDEDVIARCDEATSIELAVCHLSGGCNSTSIVPEHPALTEARPPVPLCGAFSREVGNHTPSIAKLAAVLKKDIAHPSLST